MASQYDAIGSKYSIFKELPTSIVEEENIKEAITPYLPSTPHPRVLDLACGTGYYSKKVIDWGAENVVGVDLSSGMVNAARAIVVKDDRYAGKVEFRVGNALDLCKINDEAPFDAVIGAWLLNYSSSLEEMTKMYASISLNLKEGGVFVGITLAPAEDVDAFAKRWMETQKTFPEAFPIRVDYYERLESGDGYKTEVSNNMGGEKVSFRNFHLSKTIYEQAARQGGLRGKLEWKEIKIPERVRPALKDEFWKMYHEVKHMGVLVVEKS